MELIYDQDPGSKNKTMKRYKGKEIKFWLDKNENLL